MVRPDPADPRIPARAVPARPAPAGPAVPSPTPAARPHPPLPNPAASAPPRPAPVHAAEQREPPPPDPAPKATTPSQPSGRTQLPPGATQTSRSPSSLVAICGTHPNGHLPGVCMVPRTGFRHIAAPQHRATGRDRQLIGNRSKALPPCEEARSGTMSRAWPLTTGADDENRTRVVCLEGRGSTIELHPHAQTILPQNPRPRHPTCRPAAKPWCVRAPRPGKLPSVRTEVHPGPTAGCGAVW